MVRPIAVDSAPENSRKSEADGKAAKQGFIIPNFVRGALLLENSNGVTYRLSWQEEGSAHTAKAKNDSNKDRRRALPAGEYTLVGYRMWQVDDEGIRWDLSATNPKMRKVKIAPGVALDLGVDQTIHFRHSQKHNSIGVDIYGDNHSGVAIYRDGKRISIGFKLLDAKGNARFEGRIRYG